MAVPLTKLSWWWWGGKEKEQVCNGSATNLFSDLGFDLKESEGLTFRSTRGRNLALSNRKIKRKWKSREERKIDKEYDVVLVPSDGGVCLSGSESDDSDWSIGWLEPHAPTRETIVLPCWSRAIRGER